jgi:branched-chain amino acid aminotransferase
MVVMSPARAYYRGEVRVIIATEYSKGVVGYVKLCGSYSFYLMVLHVKRL